MFWYGGERCCCDSGSVVVGTIVARLHGHAESEKRSYMVCGTLVTVQCMRYFFLCECVCVCVRVWAMLAAQYINTSNN